MTTMFARNRKRNLKLYINVRRRIENADHVGQKNGSRSFNAYSQNRPTDQREILVIEK
jgi:hypothetical protein